MTNLIFSGPIQSSHYEDSSDDDCDDGHAQFELTDLRVLNFPAFFARF